MMPIFENGFDELVLAGEVAVEGNFSDAGRGDNAIYAGRADSFSIKQVVSGFEDAVPRR